jgi:GTP pyrophosphokinase
VELGRRVFDKEARRFGLNPAKLLESDAMLKVCAELAAAKPEDVLAQLGYGKVSPRHVLDRLVPQDQLKEQAPENAVLSAVKRVLRPGGDLDRIKVRGVDDVMVFRAKCCNPIRGERIVGYITRGKGVSVHSANCTNVVNLMYDPERRIDVEWDKGDDTAPYTVRLMMEVEDRKGILADLSARIADINTNITNMEATTGDKRGRIEMTVEIKDLKHLEKVIKSLRGVDGVLGVERAAP